MQRLAVIARLKPNTEKRATELIETGPPFDPDELGFDRHSVYLSRKSGRLRIRRRPTRPPPAHGRPGSGQRASVRQVGAYHRRVPERRARGLHLAAGERCAAGASSATMPGRPDRYRVLIAGGGVAALEAMVALRTLAEDRVDIELLSPDRDFYYRPLAVTEPFGAGRHAALRHPRACDGLRRTAPPRLARLGLPRQAPGDHGPRGFASLRLSDPRHRRAPVHRRSGRTDLPRQRGLAGVLADSRRGTLRRRQDARLRRPERRDLAAAALRTRAADGDRNSQKRKSGWRSASSRRRKRRSVSSDTGVEVVAELLADKGIELVSECPCRAVRRGARSSRSRGPVGPTVQLLFPVSAEIPIGGVPADGSGFVHRRRRTRQRPRRRLRSGRRYELPDEARRAGRTAGRCRGLVDRRESRSLRSSSRPSTLFLRGLLLTGRSRTYLRAELGGGHMYASIAGEVAALVAAGEDRGPLPLAVPRRAHRPRVRRFRTAGATRLVAPAR